jgi:hypothetical protein
MNLRVAKLICNVTFPLTPALSLEERVKLFQRWKKSRALGFTKSLQEYFQMYQDAISVVQCLASQSPEEKKLFRGVFHTR